LFILRPEDGDSAVTDITQISVTTKGTAGTASVWGLEIIAPIAAPAITAAAHDILWASLTASVLNPAVPTAGTLTSYLAIVAINSTVIGSLANYVTGVLNA